MPKVIKVNVPQKDGEIVVSYATPEPLTFTVTEGTVNADSDAEADLLLSVVDGSSLAAPSK